MILEIPTRSNIHLIAFICANGGTYKEFKREEKTIVIESEKTLEEWRAKHMTSCCKKVDVALLEIRNIIR